jgi:CheY-like chemotaxis protein
MKILTVEDDPIARLVLESILRRQGYDPSSAQSGDEAWTAIQIGRPDVVISDWFMPGVDGLELCRRVRKLGGAYVYFILVTTASADQRNREEAVAAGVDEFLTKPVDEFELRMRLRGAQRLVEYVDRLRTLESNLPICSYCKKIRNDSSYWQQIESYLLDRTGTLFSHAICPECFESQVQPQLRAQGIEIEYSEDDLRRPRVERVSPPPDDAKRTD